jgi:hypothetical protein
MKVTAEEYEPMEMGPYRARVKSYEEDEMQFGPCFKWYFEITEEGEYEGKVLSGITSQAFNPKSKLYQWVQGIMGRTIKAGETIDLDDLVGKECMLNIGHKVKERGTFEVIDGVNPVRRAKAKVPGTDAETEKEIDDIPF